MCGEISQTDYCYAQGLSYNNNFMITNETNDCQLIIITHTVGITNLIVICTHAFS